MAEKVKDKLIRLERELTDSIRSELSLAEQVNTFYSELRSLQACFTEYATDHGLAHDQQTALLFLRSYTDNKKMLNDKQIRYDFGDKQ